MKIKETNIYIPPRVIGQIKKLLIGLCTSLQAKSSSFNNNLLGLTNLCGLKGWSTFREYHLSLGFHTFIKM